MSLLDDALKEMDFEFGQNQEETPCGGAGDEEPGKLVDFHRMGSEEEEMEGGKDVVSMDMPFMIRIFELVRENIKSDEDLHHVADKLLDLSRDGGPITMDHYDEFREFEGGGEEMPDEEGGEPPMELEPPEEDCEMSGPISIESLLAASKKMTEASAHGFKRPKTQNERKASTGGGVRAKRSRKNLPNAYDDKPTSQPEKNWKGYRKTQYKKGK